MKKENNQLQNEKVLVKKQKKSTKKIELNPNGEVYCFKEKRLCPRDKADIHEMADRLWKYAQTDGVVNFEDFCADEGIAVNMLNYWAKSDEHFGQMYQRSKLKIGARLDKGLWYKQLEFRNRISLYNYLPRAEKEDEREDEREINRRIRIGKELSKESDNKIVVIQIPTVPDTGLPTPEQRKKKAAHE